ncbi:YfbM family protein [Streptomyces zhihengii]|uniref:YfbM family protein n=1 Tax=Streptomyces zhihengii TaxID=1818004 RepID=UPI00367D6805
MSMIGEYFRLTPADLERAREDTDWALDHVEEVREAEEGGPSSVPARHFSTYKAWHLLDHLLKRSGFPVDVVHGEEPLEGADDWGYGPPHYLTAERVRLCSTALSALTYDRLVDGVDPGELDAAEIYPLHWEDRAALEWGRGWFTGLTAYFAAAARDGHAVLVWID